MNFADIVAVVEWPAVQRELQRCHPAGTHRMAQFEQAYAEVKRLQAAPSGMQICFSVGDEEVAVHGEDGSYFEDEIDKTLATGTIARFNLSFTPWPEWLGMRLNSQILDGYSNAEIVAHCLWEMTFVGFSNAQVQSALAERLGGES